jgi:hypothetical protein
MTGLEHLFSSFHMSNSSNSLICHLYQKILSMEKKIDDQEQVIWRQGMAIRSMEKQLKSLDKVRMEHIHLHAQMDTDAWWYEKLSTFFQTTSFITIPSSSSTNDIEQTPNIDIQPTNDHKIQTSMYSYLIEQKEEKEKPSYIF